MKWDSIKYLLHYLLLNIKSEERKTKYLYIYHRKLQIICLLLTYIMFSHLYRSTAGRRPLPCNKILYGFAQIASKSCIMKVKEKLNCSERKNLIYNIQELQTTIRNLKGGVRIFTSLNPKYSTIFSAFYCGSSCVLSTVVQIRGGSRLLLHIFNK